MAPFKVILPDGRTMDRKNTLQSFTIPLTVKAHIAKKGVTDNAGGGVNVNVRVISTTTTTTEARW